MKPWTFGAYSAWQGTAHVIVECPGAGRLLYFDDVDMAVNWLYTNGHKPAARSLNAHVKATA